MTATLEEYITQGLISVQKHPTEDLYIYNYTRRAQFDNVWDEITINHRGTIKNGNGELIARPFPKFFNLDQAQELNLYHPAGSFKVYDKLDGSLGILYWIDDTPFIATRGSFTSEQASYANQNLVPKYIDYISQFDKNYTYLFEIIYPGNRVVVDYGKDEKLILLATIHTQTGEEVEIEEVEYPDKVKKYDGIHDISQIQEILENDTDEGVVIRFDNNFRVKIKWEEYKRLHRILTNVSARSFWKIKMYELSPQLYPYWEGDIEKILDRVPDEFDSWAKAVLLSFDEEAQKIKDEVEAVYDKIKHLERKDQAKIAFSEHKRVANLVMNRVDGRSLDLNIMKMLEPKLEKPFKEDES